MKSKSKVRQRSGFVSLIACLVMIVMVMTLALPAYAAGGYNVVTDDYDGIVESSDIKKIEEYASKTTQHNVAVYVGFDASSAEKAIDTVTDTKYQEIFPANNKGILIVILFDEEEYAVEVAVGTDVKMSDSQIQEMADMVFESYYDYDTDSAWIAGSFGTVVSYVEKFEKASSAPAATKPAGNTSSEKAPTVNKENTTTEKTKSGGGKWIFFGILSFLGAAASLAGCGVCFSKYKTAQDELEQERREKESAKQAASDAESRLAEAKEEYEKAMSWAALAKTACPNIFDIIETHLHKEEAEKFTGKYPKDGHNFMTSSSFCARALEEYQALDANVRQYIPYDEAYILSCKEAAIEREAKGEAEVFMRKYPNASFSVSSENFSKAEAMLDAYDSLSADVKRFVRYDEETIAALRSTCDDCAKLYAKEAEARLQSIYNSYPEENVGNMDYYDDGYSYYNSLPIVVRHYIPVHFWNDFTRRRRHIHDRHEEMMAPPPPPPRPKPSGSGYGGSNYGGTNQNRSSSSNGFKSSNSGGSSQRRSSGSSFGSSSFGGSGSRRSSSSSSTRRSSSMSRPRSSGSRSGGRRR